MMAIVWIKPDSPQYFQSQQNRSGWYRIKKEANKMKKNSGERMVKNGI